MDRGRYLGMKELGEHDDPYAVVRRTCAASTALVAVILSIKKVMLVNRECGLLPSETLKEVSFLFYMERDSCLW